MKIRIKDELEFRKSMLREGYTHNKLALAAEVSVFTMIRYLKGANIKPTTANKLCKILHLKFEDVFEIVDITEEQAKI